MAAILNSTMLDSDTAILDSETFLSSLRFTQRLSPSTLTLTETNSIWLTWWWQPSWILPSWILPSWIQPFCTKHWLKLIQSDSNSIILTQLDEAAILNYAILNLAILDSDTLFSSLRFIQKHSHSTLTLAQTNSIWLKLIHSDSTWWWQPSWIWPSWIQPS